MSAVINQRPGKYTARECH